MQAIDSKNEMANMHQTLCLRLLDKANTDGKINTYECKIIITLYLLQIVLKFYIVVLQGLNQYETLIKILNGPLGKLHNLKTEKRKTLVEAYTKIGDLTVAKQLEEDTAGDRPLMPCQPSGPYSQAHPAFSTTSERIQYFISKFREVSGNGTCNLIKPSLL